MAPSTHGLVTSIPELVASLNARRKKGENVTFRSVMQERILARGDGPETDVYQECLEFAYAEAGVNPNVTTVQQVLTEEPYKDFKWAIQEVVRDAVALSLSQDDFAADFIVSSEITGKSEGTQPLYPRNTKAKVKKSTPMADPFRSKIELGEKSFGTFRYTHAFNIAYDTIRHMSLNALGLHMALASRNLKSIRLYNLIKTLVEGEKATDVKKEPVDESVAEIGMTTAGTFAKKDLNRVWIRMSQLTGMPNAIIAKTEDTLDLLDMELFSKPVQGEPEKKLRLRRPLPSQMDIYPYDNVLEDGDLLLVDKTKAIGEVVDQPLMVESEKLILHQEVDTVASLKTGFFTIIPTARILMKKGLAYASSKFPDWFATEEFK